MTVVLLVCVELADEFMIADLTRLDFLLFSSSFLLEFWSVAVRLAVEVLSSVWFEVTLPPQPLPPLSKALSLSFLVWDGDDSDIVDELDELVEEAVSCLFLYKMPFSSSISSTRLIIKFGLLFWLWLLLLLLRLGCDALDDSMLVPIPDS